jgi:hypothetical protein
MKSVRIVTLVFVFSLLFLSCKISINRTININNGERLHASPTTVNGSILVGSDCEIYGTCRTVNGVIEVGRGSKVRDLQSVNGSISVEENVYVSGSLLAVNGSVSCRPDVKVKRKIATVNGNIELQKTRVKRDIQTYNGNVSLSDSTIVYGDVIIKRDKGSSWRQKPLRIEIRDGSVVEGNVVAERDDDKVELILSGGGRVLGDVIDVEVIEE